MNKILLLLLVVSLIIPSMVSARIEMVTLPEKGVNQLTIYNSADITMVRDERELTFKKGLNRIEFSWANTLIDPTSVVFLPLAQKDKLQILDTTFPPRIANTLVWNIKSDFSGKVPVAISYFTSGITWSADYFLEMDKAEEKARLRGFVQVVNRSGEDYKNSQVRLVVGKINMVESIGRLAEGIQVQRAVSKYEKKTLRRESFKSKSSGFEDNFSLGSAAPKEIVKEGLSEYFIYTVEGRETINNTWGKRLPSFVIDELPVKSLFKYEDYRLGNQPVRFVTFLNNKAHNMGQEPLPDGVLRILKNDSSNNLQYLGQASQKYIPVDATVEVNLGQDPEVKTELLLMNYKVDGHTFNNRGEIQGWDTWQTYRIRVRNFKSNPITIRIRRRHHGKFEVTSEQAHRMEDFRTIEFTQKVAAQTDFDIVYTVRTFNGSNADGK